MFTEIFGLLKINESTVSDKDEEVQRRTAEVYSEHLCVTKLCHSSDESSCIIMESRAEERGRSSQQKTLRESITTLI